MQTSYSQFCLDQMNLPRWRLHTNRYAVIKNQQDQAVGHLLLAAITDDCDEEAMMKLIAAMLNAIKLKTEAFKNGLPTKKLDEGFVLIMGDINVSNDNLEQYQVVHPAQILKNPALKRDVWNTLKGIVHS